jgi:alkylhydroperoxidase family enzyme
VFEELRRHFNERQIVELTARIGLCGLFNRLNDALQIEPEAGIIIEGDSGHQGR